MRGWLSKEPKTLREYLESILFLFLVCKASMIVGVIFVEVFLPKSFSGGENREPTVFQAIVIAPFFEELLFRAPFLYLAVRYCRLFLLPTVLISSVIFGYVHGDISNIFIQGVAGILFSVTFLKCGGMAGKFLKPTLSGMVFHAVLNGSNFIILFFLR